MIALVIAGLLLGPITLVGAVYLWWHRPAWLLAIYLLLMPFHTLTFQVIRVELGLSSGLTTLLQSWKDLLLLALVLRVVILVLLSGRLRMAHAWVLPLLLLYLLTGVWGVINSPALVAGLYGFRGTFEPLALLVLALTLPISLRWVRTLPAGLLGVGGIVAAFAIFQVFWLGYNFLWRYYAVDGRIANSFSFLGGAFQRAMGTFSSPNQFSLYLTFVVLLGLNLALRLPRWRWPTLALVGLLFSALLLTVSRSGWVACVVGIAFSGLIWRRKQVFALPLLLLILIAVPTGLALGLDRHLFNTISLNDPSAAYRFDINRQNLETVIANPLGVGLGVVGARALNTRIVGADGQLYATESYYFQTAMELGVPGLLLFLVLLCSCAYVAYVNIFRLRDPLHRGLAVTAVAWVAAAMAHGLFIADFQELTVGSYLWLLLGLAMRLPVLENRALAGQPTPVTPPLVDALVAPAAD